MKATENKTEQTIPPQRPAVVWQDIIIAGCRHLIDAAGDDADGLARVIYDALHEIPDYGSVIALTALGTLAAWMTDREALAVLTDWQERAQIRVLIDDHTRRCPECGQYRPDWTAIEAARAHQPRGRRGQEENA